MSKVLDRRARWLLAMVASSVMALDKRVPMKALRDQLLWCHDTYFKTCIVVWLIAGWGIYFLAGK